MPAKRKAIVDQIDDLFAEPLLAYRVVKVDSDGAYWTNCGAPSLRPLVVLFERDGLKDMFHEYLKTPC